MHLARRKAVETVDTLSTANVVKLAFSFFGCMSAVN